MTAARPKNHEWLAKTTEAPLEPERPICDPHHHFWDRRSARIPYQRFQLDELSTDMQSGHNIRSTVFIECRSMYRKDGPQEMRPVGEVEYVQGQAAASASGLYGPGRAATRLAATCQTPSPSRPQTGCRGYELLRSLNCRLFLTPRPRRHRHGCRRSSAQERRIRSAGPLALSCGVVGSAAGDGR